MQETQAPCIQIIDDDITQRMLVKEYLEQAGYIVRQSNDGQHGLRMASKVQTDLILLDYLLPSMDGLAVCKALRQTPSTQSVPIILMTASKDPEVISKGLAAGATDFITKPVEWQFLADRVTHVINQAHQFRTLQAMNRRLEDGLLAAKSEQEQPGFDDGTEQLEAERQLILAQAEEQVAAVRAAADTALSDAQRRFEERTHQISAEAEERVRRTQIKAEAEVRSAQDALERFVLAMGSDTSAAPAPAAPAAPTPVAQFWNLATTLSFEQGSIVCAIMDATRHIASIAHAQSDAGLIEASKALARNTQKLAQSLGGFNTLSAHMAGLTAFHERELDLAREVAAALAGLDSHLRWGKVGVRTSIPDGLRVLADAEQLQVLMRNILGNAVRFSMADSQIAVEAVVNPNGSLALTIRDQGIGIQPALIEKLRASIDQPANMLTRQDNLPGFGIPVASAIARRHDGRLEFESRVGQGTAVTLLLPADRVMADRDADADVRTGT